MPDIGTMDTTRKPSSKDDSGVRNVRIITFNVRYATDSPFPGEEPWKEVLRSQLDDILNGLGDGWDFVGQGRDGNNSGEFSPILYLQESWSPLQYQTYWLSPTPEKPSKGWDAALNRIVTVAFFKDGESMNTDAKVIVMSTHLDHRGELARQESAKLVVKIAHEWRDKFTIDEAFQPPVFLAGDFNSTPDGIAYQEVVRPETGFTDVRSLVPKAQRYGNDEITYTSFAGEERQTRIDFIFALKGEDQVRFPTYAILPNVFDDGIFLSDHRAIIVDGNINVSKPPS